MKVAYLFQSVVVAAVALAMSIALPSSASARSLDDIIASGNVRIAVGTDWPPYDTIDENLDPAGYDIDVANIMAEDLGVELELVVTTAANRVAFLVTDKVDIVIWGFSATPARAKSVSFSHAYGMTFLGVYGPEDLDVSSYEDLVGKTIAVDIGGTSDLEVTRNEVEGMNILRMESNALVHRAYKSGQADVMVTSNLTARELAKEDPDTEYATKFVLRQDPLHIGVPRGDPDLLQWVNTFVYYHKLIGDFNELSKKWVGEPLIDMQEAP
jgi:polar amino acid transport system substrate-binding protein